MVNLAMIQFFEWFVPADGRHWSRLKESSPELASMGIKGVWIPPPTKGCSAQDVGYGTYDLWDLGEFNQKGIIGTKYGIKAELTEAIDEAKKHGLDIYSDIVLNHKACADETEVFLATEVNRSNRNQDISGPYNIAGWTKFTYPGRGKKYSQFKWNFNHFTGVDWNEELHKSSIYRIMGNGKYWSDQVDKEYGNYDYLMFSDVDYNHPEVIEETKKWAVWLAKELKLTGFRLDAAKHIHEHFIAELMSHVRQELGNDNFYSIGEYWKDSIDPIEHFLQNINFSIDLFDVPLHYNFQEASIRGKEFDMRTVFDGTIVQKYPDISVTFVDNHDSQPGQSLESWVQDWFKPIAYALILLRQAGYPCIFYGDLYGISGDRPIPPKFDIIHKLALARKEYSYGEQRDYFDHGNTVGWVRMGENGTNPDAKACAVVICNSEGGNKIMHVGKHRIGQKWRDYLGHVQDTVIIDENGRGNFRANGGSVSVWVPYK
ncbi:hypothetical protein K7432_010863 [Basidiobolus ranarum]|uniref:Glycosyl hydrolase family 13 catalytic domain-containing protein n=1 Tax=Basidiobolus ranarum TaxID=34480 RepID=A0ABR2WN31_9FUNG